MFLPSNGAIEIEEFPFGRELTVESLRECYRLISQRMLEETCRPRPKSTVGTTTIPAQWPTTLSKPISMRKF
jgi:hypothetical protein